MTAEMTSDGPSYIYTAFEQYSDANYKAPGERCPRFFPVRHFDAIPNTCAAIRVPAP